MCIVAQLPWENNGASLWQASEKIKISLALD